ncbi:hypothetical protein HW555_005928 [Spodoptera exigua]|uniref:tRNA-splicing endonuclease subunit Sen2 n=1 Tax=Spodoptera exigua TaxID=7107 RepID=A0A835GI31_SPOEX|nr:hypothetical protein HW555_005928 [Spodoptera exigua]
MTTLQSEDCQTNDLNDSFPMAVESLRFPLDNSMRIVFTGYYNGFNVEVRSVEEIALLYHMGCFGKGTTSRSEPKADKSDIMPRIIRKRQFLKRNYWYKKFGTSDKLGTAEADDFMKDIDSLMIKIIGDSKKSYNKEDLVVIVPNSESEGENYFENMRPKCCLNKINIQEKLMLTPEEAFFLLYGLGCLQIVSLDNALLSIEKCWDLFRAVDGRFLSKYVVYHYYRSKGYVVKPGIKFGGDYSYHADYVVIIRSDNKEEEWIQTLGLVRVANTTVKEVIAVEVVEPNKTEVELPKDLKLYSVRELLLSRNLPITINEDD